MGPLSAGAEQAFEQLGPSGPHQPGNPHDLAAPQREADVPKLPLITGATVRQRETADLQDHFSGDPVAAKVGLLDFAADHQVG